MVVFVVLPFIILAQNIVRNQIPKVLQ